MKNIYWFYHAFSIALKDLYRILDSFGVWSKALFPFFSSLIAVLNWGFLCEANVTITIICALQYWHQCTLASYYTGRISLECLKHNLLVTSLLVFTFTLLGFTWPCYRSYYDLQGRICLLTNWQLTDWLLHDKIQFHNGQLLT